MFGALVGSLAGGAFVAAQTGDTTIHACVNNNTGAVAILTDPSGYTNPQGTNCSGTLGSQLHPLDWSQQGPQGQQGAPGVTGPAGANASILFAHVSASGNLQSGSPGVHASLVRDGIYKLTFPGNDTGCAPVAVPTGSGKSAHAAAKNPAPAYLVPDSIVFNGTITSIGLPELDAGGKDAGQLTPTQPFNMYLLCPPG
jgi:hypothetical protein